MTDTLDTLAAMFSSGLMQRALIAAVLVGLTAPIVGTYLVQRRLALLGDGIGHVALTGVALGWLAGTVFSLSPVDTLAVPGAVVISVVGALLIEWVRSTGRTTGDVALALMFYGGIAGGVLIISLAGGSAARLNGYLFGSISAVTSSDLVLIVILAAIIVVVGLGLRPALFVLCHDEQFARACGLPTGLLNVVISAMAALTVSLSMRVVGVLLVSAIMIVPVAAAQLLTTSFQRTMHLAMGIGVFSAVIGLMVTYYYPLSPGAMIVILSIGIYAVASIVGPLVRRRRHHDPHPEMEDDVVIEGDQVRETSDTTANSR